MKKTYESPVLTLLALCTEDVIAASEDHDLGASFRELWQSSLPTNEE